MQNENTRRALTGWTKGLCLMTVAALAGGITSCAGPQPLHVAIRPQDEAEYLSFANDADLDGRIAFARWMAGERGTTAQAVLDADRQLSETKNPFDAYHDPQAVSRGAVIFKVHCVRCHGADARGHGPATLADHPAGDFKSFGKRFAATLHRGAPRKWFRVIRDGTGDVVQYPDGPSPAMPPFGDTLAREQIWLVITYLQSLDAYAGDTTAS